MDRAAMHWCFLGLALVTMLGPGMSVSAQQTGSPSPSAQIPDPQLKVRPAPKAQVLEVPKGRMQLDLVVTDAAGKPVQGLQPWDLKLLDNGQAQKILTFHGYNDTDVRPSPPVEVILVLDTVNLTFPQVAFVRDQLEQFFKQDSGHLKQPVSLILLTNTGIRVMPRPTVDGNAIQHVLGQVHGSLRTMDVSSGGEGLLERYQLCARQLQDIAENEARKPGRKLLIWISSGWPMLSRPVEGTVSDKNQRRNFRGIVELSTRLREARMVLYSVAPADIGAGGSDAYNATRYLQFVKGVRTASEADTGDLALKVLVTHTGGQVLGPGNDLVAQIDRCIADANGFYHISFNPAPAAHADEYHDLKVAVDQPGVAVRMDTGYYNQPADSPK